MILEILESKNGVGSNYWEGPQLAQPVTKEDQPLIGAKAVS